MNTLGERIKIARTNARLTQPALAKKIGVTKSAISQWETGTTKTMDGLKLVELAHALSVNIEWLAKGKGPMEAISLQLSDAHAQATADSIAITQPNFSAEQKNIFKLMDKAKGNVSPRSYTALSRIAVAAVSGQLSEDDLILLETISERITGGCNVTNTESTHHRNGND